MIYHKFFENLVSVERKIPLSQISDVANGKIFMGNEAVSLKLIDDVSNEESVKQELLKHVGQKLDFKDISLKEDDKESFFSGLIDEIIKKNKDTSSKVQVLAIMK
jgi:ClpP class serine protease